jgi:hypothetical protein
VAWKFRLPNRISNPAGKGSELTMEYLWDLYSVRITIEMAGGKLIFSAKLPYLARQLLVRKVVPTLTSKSAEIYLSMVDAKQQNYKGLSWFRSWGIRPAGVYLSILSSARPGPQARPGPGPRQARPRTLLDGVGRDLEARENFFGPSPARNAVFSCFTL